jgi:hypothetical protein
LLAKEIFTLRNASGVEFQLETFENWLNRSENILRFFKIQGSLEFFLGNSDNPGNPEIPHSLEI